MADLTLDDIPLERVAELARVLLGVEDVDDVMEVHIDYDCVTARIYAKDDSGHRYVGLNDETATHLITGRVTSTFTPTGKDGA